ncbi:MAG: hypothetical protein WC990_02630 [Sphaerochaetaceae bacterium]
MKKGTLLVLVLLIIVMVSSCSSLSVWVKSNIEGVPSWVYEQQDKKNQISFVGIGSGTNATRTRLLAYESILTQISDFIGDDVSDRHIGQLSSTNAIDEYRLKVTREFVKEDEHSHTLYLLAVADRSLLEQERSSASVFILEAQKRIDNLFLDAARLYRENKDMKAFSAYIEIALLASTLPSDSGDSYRDDALNRASSILNSMTLSVSEGDPSLASTQITLRRKGRTFSPRVKEATILVQPIARDGLGSYYKDHQYVITDNNGQIQFVTNNPTIISEGVIDVYLSIEKELSQLATIDPQKAKEFKERVDAKMEQFSYKRSSIVQRGPMGVYVREFSEQGDQLSTLYAQSAIVKALESDHISTKEDTTHVVDEDNLISSLREMFPTSQYVLYGSVGQTLQLETQVGDTVTVLGEVSLIHLPTGRVVGTTSRFQTNARAIGMEKARSHVLTQFGNQAFFLLYRKLYP